MTIATIKKNAKVEWWILSSKILHQILKISYLNQSVQELMH